MTEANRELWRRIEAFELDTPGSSLTFTRRLARENGWSHEFARRVVEEYKRFVFLAMTAGHEVTPSDEVDQAWHLHLTYTRSYWDELCGEVLGRPLHHGPTKGGKAEGDRFEDQYERTLASYRDAFGEPAPVDVWPPSEVRFGLVVDWVRVNRQRTWLTPKPRPRHVMASLVAVGGVTPLAATEARDAVLGLLLIVVLGLFLRFCFVSTRSERKRRGDGSTSSTSSDSGGGFWWGGCGSGGDGGGDSGCGGGGCGGGGCGGCGG